MALTGLSHGLLNYKVFINSIIIFQNNYRWFIHNICTYVKMYFQLKIFFKADKLCLGSLRCDM